jgi:hypothetical protein
VTLLDPRGIALSAVSEPIEGPLQPHPFILGIVSLAGNSGVTP